MKISKNLLSLSVLSTVLLSGCSGGSGSNGSSSAPPATTNTAQQVVIQPVGGRIDTVALAQSFKNYKMTITPVANSRTVKGTMATLDMTNGQNNNIYSNTLGVVNATRGIFSVAGGSIVGLQSDTIKNFSNEFLGPLSGLMGVGGVIWSLVNAFDPALQPPNYQKEINALQSQIDSITNEIGQMEGHLNSQDQAISQLNYWIHIMMSDTVGANYSNLVASAKQIGSFQVDDTESGYYDTTNAYFYFQKYSYLGSNNAGNQNASCLGTESAAETACIAAFAVNHLSALNAGATPYYSAQQAKLWGQDATAMPDITGWDLVADANYNYHLQRVPASTPSRLDTYLSSLQGALRTKLNDIITGANTTITVVQALDAYNNSVKLTYNQLMSSLLQAYNMEQMVSQLNYINAMNYAYARESGDTSVKLTQVSYSNEADTNFVFSVASDSTDSPDALTANYTATTGNLANLYGNRFNALESTIASYMISDPVLPNQKLPSNFYVAESVVLPGGITVSLAPYADLYSKMSSATNFITNNSSSTIVLPTGSYRNNVVFYQYAGLVDYTNCSAADGSCPSVFANSLDSFQPTISSTKLQGYYADANGALKHTQLLNLTVDCMTSEVEYVGGFLQCVSLNSDNMTYSGINGYDIRNTSMPVNSLMTGLDIPSGTILANNTSFSSLQSATSLSLTDSKHLVWNNDNATGTLAVTLPNGVRVPVSIRISTFTPYDGTRVNTYELGASQGDANLIKVPYFCSIYNTVMIDCTTMDGKSYIISLFILRQSVGGADAVLSVTEKTQAEATLPFSGNQYATITTTISGNVAILVQQTTGLTATYYPNKFWPLAISYSPNDSLDYTGSGVYTGSVYDMSGNLQSLSSSNNAGAGFFYPGGTYLGTCRFPTYLNGTLSTYCPAPSGYVLNSVQVPLGASCENNNGNLSCTIPNGPASGNWLSSCINTNVGSTFITTSCKQTNGDYIPSWTYKVSGNSCDNVNGHLICTNPPALDTPQADIYPTNTTWNIGTRIYPSTKTYSVILQSDGNLVAATNDESYLPLWASTKHPNGTVVKVSFQSDGNLVGIDANGQAVWNSGTQGNPDAKLSLQPDGNLVIYSASGTALWSAQQNFPAN